MLQINLLNYLVWWQWYRAISCQVEIPFRISTKTYSRFSSKLGGENLGVEEDHVWTFLQEEPEI